MGRSLLGMGNDEIYESSLRFLGIQLDLYVESNKQTNGKNKGHKVNNNSEEVRLMVMD